MKIKQAWIHLIAILSMYIITLVYFAPLTLNNKVINQSDITKGKGNTHQIDEYKKQTGEEALWNPAIFSGMPAFIMGVHYPSWDIKSDITSVITFFLKKPANLIFLAMLGAYIMLLALRIHPLISLLGAIAFGFCTFNIIGVEVGHNSKIRAVGFLPFVFAGVFLIRRYKYLLGLGVGCMGFMLMFATGHYQIIYYSLMTLGIFYVSEFIFSLKYKEYNYLIKFTSFLILIGLFGAASNIAQVWSTKQYGAHSIRGEYVLETTKASGKQNKEGLDKSYAFAWSNAILEPMTLLIPRYYGGGRENLGSDSNVGKQLSKMNVPQRGINQFTSNLPTYWGPQPFTEGPVYAGAVIVLFFVIGMFTLNKRQKIWLLVTFVFFIMISWGDNFKLLNYFLFDYLPYYNKFRTPTMGMIIIIFVMAIAGGLGVNNLLHTQKRQKALYILLKATAITGGICLIAMIFGPAIHSFSGNTDTRLIQSLQGSLGRQGAQKVLDALKEDREGMLINDALRSLFIVLISGAVIYFFLKDKINQKLAFIILAVIILFDLWKINVNYLGKEVYQRKKIEKSINPTPANNYIMQDTSKHYRVYNRQNTFNDSRTSFFHYSIGGYHPAKMRRYQDITEFYLGNKKGNRNNINLDVLRMLNTKYVIKKPGKNDKDGVPDKNEVAQVPGVCGPAWFIENLKPVSDPDEEIEALEDFEPDSVAFYDKSEFSIDKHQYNNEGSITLQKYTPNEVVYKYNSDKEGFAVFSEVYYPHGWHVTVDGKEIKHIRVNYILRGMKVPAGQHKITFKFEPQSYVLGTKISVTFTYIIFGLFIISLVWEGKKEFYDRNRNE